MQTAQPPIPPALRCLAILPVFIMLGAYAFLAPRPAEKSAPPIAPSAVIVGHAVEKEAPVNGLPPVGEQLGVPEEPVSALAP